MGLGVGVYLVSAANMPKQAPFQQSSVFQTVSAPVFGEELADRVVIDTRTAEEFGSGHLPQAINLDFYAPDFRAQLQQLDRDTPYAIYCRSGNRSGQTLSLMKALGFTNVQDLRGGIVAWQAAGNILCTTC